MLFGDSCQSQSRSKISMFTDKDILYHDHEHIRDDHIWTCITHLIKRRKLSRWLVKLLYHASATTESREMGELNCPCLASKRL